MENAALNNISNPHTSFATACFSVYTHPKIRIDKFLSKNFPKYSRNKIQELIENRKIFVNAKVLENNSYNVKFKDEICVNFQQIEKNDTIIVPDKSVKFDVLYEDDDLLVIDKPPFLTVHPGAGNLSGTLVHGLKYYCSAEKKNDSQAEDDLKTENKKINGMLDVKKNNLIQGSERMNERNCSLPDSQNCNLSQTNSVRPGIVHRIDKDTSGILVIAKNDYVHAHLAEQFKSHTIIRKYVCFCHNVPKFKNGKIENNIGRDPHNRVKMAILNVGGKRAVTLYNVVKKYDFGNCEFSKIICELKTGRTHQIRVHMLSLGCPLIGDGVYSHRVNEFGLKRQALHAFFLSFQHPISKEQMTFESQLPMDLEGMESFLDKR